MNSDNLKEKIVSFVIKVSSSLILNRRIRHKLRQEWWYKYIILPHIASNKLKTGLNTKLREKELIVSLTSYPARINELHACIFSLLDQSCKADRVILYLAKSQFPNLEQNLPQSLLNLQKLGLTISWYDEDIRSYKKLIPTLQQYPEAVIITADDDFYYPKDYIKTLYEAYRQNPNCLHCHRAHYIEFDPDGNIAPYLSWKKRVKTTKAQFSNFCTTGAGVIFPPHILHKDATNKELFLKLAPTADDIWFWAMAVANNIKINKLPFFLMEKRCTLPCQSDNDKPLNAINCAQGQNDVQLAAVLKQYPQILQKLHAERNL